MNETDKDQRRCYCDHPSCSWCSLGANEPFQGFDRTAFSGLEPVAPLNPPAFFLVWSPKGGVPTVKHATWESASDEARRLAEKHRDRSFYILRSVEEVKQVVVQTAIVRTSFAC